MISTNLYDDDLGEKKREKDSNWPPNPFALFHNPTRGEKVQRVIKLMKNVFQNFSLVHSERASLFFFVHVNVSQLAAALNSPKMHPALHLKSFTSCFAS